MLFRCEETDVDVDIGHCTVAGWTGRDPAAVAHHIGELAAIGVAPPSLVPLFYRVSASLLTQAPAIDVVGEATSGEAEPLVVITGGRTYLGLASDHTDRALEAHSVALSKQICSKPVARALWEFDRVRGHVDRLRLRALIREREDSGWALYQEGTLSAIRSLEELVDISGMHGEENGAAMLCGTLPVVSGGVRPAVGFCMELHDPVLGRRISHAYAIRTLPVVT